MTYYAKVTGCPRQCGGRIIYDFQCFNDIEAQSLNEIKYNYKEKMLIATFNHKQHAAYEACCKEFTWLGQSKPIKNPSSGNYIFTAVFKA